MRNYLVLAFLLLVTGVAFGQQMTGAVASKDVTRYLSFTNDDYDMGKIPYGKPLEYNLTIKNISKDTVTLLSIKAGCGCTTPKYRANDLILPGKSIFITLGFNGGASGEFTKFADLYFNDGMQKQVKFHGWAFADSTGAKSAVNR